MEMQNEKVTVNGRSFSKVKAVIALAIVVVLILACVAYGTTRALQPDGLSVQGSLKMEESTLNSMLAGTIDEVLVSEGDTVKAGDVLIKISSDTVEAKLQQAQGAEAAAAAVANKAANGARAQEVAQAKAAYDYAAKQYNRMKTLLAEEAISQATFDGVEAQYIAAKETYNMAVEGARAEDKAAAAAQVSQAAGAVAEVNSYLDYSEIKAPMDGVVSSINISKGELISTGMALATVTKKSDPWVEVNVKETDLSKVHLGAEVKVKFAAYEDETFKGRIVNVSQKPDFATKRATNENGDFDILSYGVKVEITDAPKELYSGMTVIVDFEDEK
ncbi:MAG: efflux RND transporter periplasmic adaptor subunit [Clostridia bacterium]|nr:efflux RND transporter periplasmic adaptor subunit [Clostridia bacterium]